MKKTSFKRKLSDKILSGCQSKLDFDFKKNQKTFYFYFHVTRFRLTGSFPGTKSLKVEKKSKNLFLNVEKLKKFLHYEFSLFLNPARIFTYCRSFFGYDVIYPVNRLFRHDIRINSGILLSASNTKRNSSKYNMMVGTSVNKKRLEYFHYFFC